MATTDMGSVRTFIAKAPDAPSSVWKARAAFCLLLAIFLLSAARPAAAWVYPEHRQLALLAVQQLDPERKVVFDQLWQGARTGDEQRLCAQGADATQELTPACIDWAALSAIAGDHSCSSREMLDTARNAAWILSVADVAAQLKLDLGRLPVTAEPELSGKAPDVFSDAQRRLASQAVQAQRVNALRTADIRLQRADPEYATRAGSNNAHFLLARPSTLVSPLDYAALTLRIGSDVNAVGVYSWFHLSALQKASRLRDESLSTAQRNELARAALADEAFALHFLQDVFAAGHIAGSWGDTSQRQGTHDYYNQSGLEVFTWRGGGHSLVLMGDAHMRPEDAQGVAVSIQASLQQVLDVASGRTGAAEFPATPVAPAEPDAFNVCRTNNFPQRDPGIRARPEDLRLLESTLVATPVPGLGPGLGAMPRFRSEVGPFIGLAGSIDGRVIDGSFTSADASRGTVIGLDLSVRAGFGLDGVMGQSGDGLVYASVGFRADSPSSNQFSDTSRGALGGNLSAAVPARAGLSLRLRMPYYLVPGDLVLVSPMYFVNPKAYADMAVAAANGGLLRLQSGWATAVGRFQFVLGRELGVTFYGLSGDDQLLAPSVAPGGLGRAVNFKSTSFELPIAEYRPYRAFSTNQSSSVVVQLFAAADVPRGGTVRFPVGAPAPELRTVWSIGVRLVFDWRYYY
ncbi:hypothetical protein QTI66_01905 [Variovorax sp. J22R133]|uniref:hypothetical protein n=1 Tax=Variovorax brevis TaxID=3053503 RepID=UPI002576BCBA|nr:hypothetical protein [Variovorax sp. J22R133]MDM0110880.1 hypothetical protein [Variovorax sp. J22R133]